MFNEAIFYNRQEAGKLLAKKLEKYKGQAAVVYALPRGGVIVAAEIARHFNFHLDLVLTRKIGHPLNSEFAIGAVSESGELVGNILQYGNIDKYWLVAEIDRQAEEIKRRRGLYMGGKNSINALGKIAVIVDDGIATGSTIIAAIEEIKNQKPQKTIVAVPVAPPDVVDTIKKLVDDIVVVLVPDPFLGAIGAYYKEFDQVSDEEVRQLMKELH